MQPAHRSEPCLILSGGVTETSARIDGDGEVDGGTWERVSVDAIDYDDADKRGIVQASYSLLAINNKAQAEAMSNYLLNKSRYGQVFC